MESRVLALSRGGVPVAHEVANALKLGLDVFVVRKRMVPHCKESTMGVIASGGVRVLDEGVVQDIKIPDSVIARVAAQERRELQPQERLYRPEKVDYHPDGQTVVVVDDGSATGTTPVRLWPPCQWHRRRPSVQGLADIQRQHLASGIPPDRLHPIFRCLIYRAG